jgi:hypothetical protein
VWIGANSTNVSFTHGKVFDVGAGGVQIGGGLNGMDGRQADGRPSGVVVADNELTDGGHVYIMGPGVLMSACEHCTVAHNSIHNWHYSGVSGNTLPCSPPPAHPCPPPPLPSPLPPSPTNFDEPPVSTGYVLTILTVLCRSPPAMASTPAFS